MIGNPRPALTREQKVGLSFVIVCGIGALVLGGLYVWRHMAIPFVIDYEGPKLLVGEEEEAVAVAKEKSTDTDGDTISDYDEKNIYGTSAFLADTDSDGLRDDIEITSGQDPNCATGQTCDDFFEDENAMRDDGTSNTFLEDVEPPTPPTTETGLDADAVTKLRELPTAEVRKILIEAGAEPEKINVLTDEEVQELYQELLRSLSSSNE